MWIFVLPLHLALMTLDAKPVLGYLVDFRLLAPSGPSTDWVVHFLRNGVPFHSSLSGSVLATAPRLLSLSEPFLDLLPSNHTEPATLEIIVTPSDASPTTLIEASDAEAAISNHIAYFRFECGMSPRHRSIGFDFSFLTRNRLSRE